MDTGRISLRFGSFELDVRSRELRNGARARAPAGAAVRDSPAHARAARATSSRATSCVSVCGPRARSSISSTASTRRSSGCAPRSATMPTTRRSSRRVPRRGYRFIGSVPSRATTVAAAAAPRRRACGWSVLPFSNLSDDSSQEYFSDGLTEELIAQLGPLCRGQVGIIAPLVVDGLQGQPAACARDRRGAERRLSARGQHRGATARACASPRGWSKRPPRRTCGPRPTSAARPTGSRCRPTSPAASRGRCMRELVPPARAVVAPRDHPRRVSGVSERAATTGRNRETSGWTRRCAGSRRP